ncbi:MAG: hypothetical protein Q8K99_01355 [Actinomycetota bacterium]|nr:hypothetical protein [Actinomycetota bacterium]
MDYLAIANRAQLGHRLALRRIMVIHELEAAKTLFAKSKGSLSMSSREDRFLRSAFLVGVFSQVEAYMCDMAIELLVAFPGKLPKKDINLERFALSGSIVETIRASAAEHVNGVTFNKRFPDTVRTLLGFFDSKKPLDDTRLSVVNEVKCTRDVVVHNGGIVDDRYLAKAGSRSRGEEGKHVPLDDAYIEDSMDAIIGLLSEFYELGPARFTGWVPSRAFREMWEGTVLESLVPFNDAWQIEEREDHDRVILKEVSWRWSSSEKMLFDFFLAIHNPRNPAIDTNVVQALQRWKSPSSENRIMRSWLDTPFWL